MERTGIVTVDIGTTSMRAILFDGGGANRASSRRENPPVYHTDGRVEQDARSWGGILVSVLSDCAAQAARLGIVVEAISLTAQRSSVIPLDAAGTPLHPAVMWQDTRTQTLCAAMNDDSPGVYRRTGLKISPVFSAIKMRWFRLERPEIYSRTKYMAGIQDYVLFLLTGRFVTDRCLASRTNLFNLHTMDWDDELLALFGVDRSRLCDLVDQGAVCGRLTGATARATGLDEGLPVISAGGDQQCAALGLGLLSRGRIVANTGTGSYIIGHADRPVLDDRARVFCNVSAIPGSYILEAGTLTSGTVYRWFSNTCYDRLDSREQEDSGGPECGGGRPDPFAEVNADALGSVPGANGVTLLPDFNGCGAPHWNPDSRGVFFNLTLGTTRKDLARAVLEGVVAEMADNIDLVEQLSDRIDMVRVSGGLTNFDLFNRIQSDMYGRAVVRPGETEATALGAWISAAVGTGLYPGHREAYEAAAATAAESGRTERRYEPDPGTAGTYRRVRSRKNRLYEALAGAGLFSEPREHLPS